MRARDEVLGVLSVRNVRVARASDDAADVAGYIVVVFQLSFIIFMCAFHCRHVAVVVDVVYSDSVGLAVGGFSRLSGDTSGVGNTSINVLVIPSVC